MRRGVTRQEVESALATGQPFTLRTREGKAYAVPHLDYVSLPRRGEHVVVYDDRGGFTVVPFLSTTRFDLGMRRAGDGGR